MISEKSIVIDVPAATIWSYLSDLSHWRNLTAYKGILSVSYSDFSFVLPPGAVPGPGMVLSERDGDGAVEPWWIEKWEAPSRIKLVSREKSKAWGDPESQFEIEIELIPKTMVTTEVRLRCSFELKGLLIGWLIALGTAWRGQKLFDKQTESFLARLKDAVV